MSEPRRPDAIITFQPQAGERHKLELFRSSQFSNQDLQAQRQVDDEDTPTFRVRHNGVWLPPGQRVLMPLTDILELFEAAVRRQFKEK